MRDPPPPPKKGGPPPALPAQAPASAPGQTTAQLADKSGVTPSASQGELPFAKYNTVTPPIMGDAVSFIVMVFIRKFLTMPNCPTV